MIFMDTAHVTNTPVFSTKERTLFSRLSPKRADDYITTYVSHNADEFEHIMKSHKFLRKNFTNLLLYELNKQTNKQIYYCRGKFLV